MAIIALPVYSVSTHIIIIAILPSWDKLNDNFRACTYSQASIELTDEGEFIIHNEGRRPLYLGGKALLSGQSSKLTHNQTLEVSTVW